MLDIFLTAFCYTLILIYMQLVIALDTFVDRYIDMKYDDSELTLLHWYQSEAGQKITDKWFDDQHKAVEKLDALIIKATKEKERNE